MNDLTPEDSGLIGQMFQVAKTSTKQSNIHPNFKTYWLSDPTFACSDEVKVAVLQTCQTGHRTLTADRAAVVPKPVGSAMSPRPETRMRTFTAPATVLLRRGPASHLPWLRSHWRRPVLVRGQKNRTGWGSPRRAFEPCQSYSELARRVRWPRRLCRRRDH